MTKTNKIIYWVATLWLCLGMVSTSIVQIIGMKEETEKMQVLGYPMYFLTIIGLWKMLGVITVLSPKLPLLKEWAYAGFFFITSGAVVSHLVVGSNPNDLFGPSLLLVLSVLSWYFRPVNRKLVAGESKLNI